MGRLKRDDLRQLAHARLRDVQSLLENQRFSAAYYLAGYAVECGLKACVANQTESFEFPDKERANASWTHNLEKLIKTAGLEADLAARSSGDAEFQANWKVVRDWNEDSRYIEWAERAANDLFVAITDPDHGILPWIEQRW